MKRIERDSQTPDRGFGRSVPHGAVAEIFVDQPTTHVVGMLANVGRLGCFVRTRVAVPDGVKVRLKVRNGESEFEASGEVTYLVPEKGVGIRFTEARPEFDLEETEEDVNGR